MVRHKEYKYRDIILSHSVTFIYRDTTLIMPELTVHNILSLKSFTTCHISLK